MKQARSLYGCVWCSLLLFLLEPPSCFSRPQAPVFSERNIKVGFTLHGSGLASATADVGWRVAAAGCSVLDASLGRQSWIIVCAVQIGTKTSHGSVERVLTPRDATAFPEYRQPPITTPIADHILPDQDHSRYNTSNSSSKLIAGKSSVVRAKLRDTPRNVLRRVLITRVLGPHTGNRTLTSLDVGGNKPRHHREKQLTRTNDDKVYTQLSSTLRSIVPSVSLNSTAKPLVDNSSHSSSVNGMRRDNITSQGKVYLPKQKLMYSGVALSPNIGRQWNETLGSKYLIKVNGGYRHRRISTSGHNGTGKNHTVRIYQNKENVIGNYTLDSHNGTFLEGNKVWLPVGLTAKKKENDQTQTKLFPKSSETDNPLSNTIESKEITDDLEIIPQSMTKKTVSKQSDDESFKKRKIIQINETPTTTIKPDVVDLVSQFLSASVQDLRTPNREVTQPLSKMDNIKTWPNEPGGIQSLDDLILYHTYTNGNLHNQPEHSPVVLQQSDNGVISGVNKIPSVIVHHGQKWDYSTSRPKPKPPPPPLYYQQTHANKPSIIIIQDIPPTQETPVNPTYSQNHYNTKPGYSTNDDYTLISQTRPTYRPISIVNSKPTMSYTPPNYQQIYYPSNQNTIATATDKCPNIMVNTHSIYSNTNNLTKEGCADLNIVINSEVVNQNTMSARPPSYFATPPSYDEGFMFIPNIQNQEIDEGDGETTTIAVTTVATTTTTEAIVTPPAMMTNPVLNALQTLFHALFTPVGIWLFLFAPLLAGLLLVGWLLMPLFSNHGGWRHHPPQNHYYDINGWQEEEDWDRNGNQNPRREVRARPLLGLQRLLTDFETKIKSSYGNDTSSISYRGSHKS
uniref:Uncharacterized protein n=1 Tax=Timema shepardi TaxID=629360 RepID=A0A7R9G5N7_TIMSH|nr:unnamed protein product [Timema shepardi]